MQRKSFIAFLIFVSSALMHEYFLLASTHKLDLHHLWFFTLHGTLTCFEVWLSKRVMWSTIQMKILPGARQRRNVGIAFHIALFALTAPWFIYPLREMRMLEAFQDNLPAWRKSRPFSHNVHCL